MLTINSNPLIDVILFVCRRTCAACGERMAASSSPTQTDVPEIPDEKCYCGVEIKGVDPRWTRSCDGIKRNPDCSSDKRKKGSYF